MRVSERHKYDISVNRVNRAKVNNEKMLDILSSQKVINKISDDPVGSSTVIRKKNYSSDLQQFRRNIDFSLGFITRMETALTGIHDNLIRANELAISQSNSTYAQDSHDAVAEEVKELINEVIAQANTSYNGRFVFSGFRTNTPTLSTQGDYLGDDGAIFLQTQPNRFRRINIDARALFEANEDERQEGHFDLLASLEILHSGLKSGDHESIRLAINELDHQMNKTVSFQATVGAIANSLQNMSEKMELDQDKTIEEISRTEDADIYKATSDFKRAETMLQSSLQATNKILQPSLLNYMQ